MLGLNHADARRGFYGIAALFFLGWLFLPSIVAVRAPAQTASVTGFSFAESPVDLSFLNVGDQPAGRHGFLHVEGEHLAFADGTEARFWGTNITGRALFQSDKSDVQRQSRRLARLGFNLVRIHHHDAPWVKPNIFGDGRANSSALLSEEALTRLDWLIKCLEDEGIYVWLDLYDSRQLTASDQVEGFSEIEKKGVAELKGYNFVNASIEHVLKAFNERLLTHVNAFTGLRYLDDPGLAAVLVLNEDDITHHFGGALLPDKDVPFHTAAFIAAASGFASAHGYRLDDVWRTWQPGVPKIFLNDLERGFHARMVEYLRGLGLKIPILTTSQWGGNPLSSLPALTSGDLIDVHAYGGRGELSKDPHQQSNMVSDIAAAHVAGFPVSVTEWNVSPFPVSDRHAIPIYLASLARFQGWSALMQYAYTQRPLAGVDLADNWEGGRDPSLVASLPAAALLFRRGDVALARTSYVFAPTPDQLFSDAIGPATSLALRTAVERGKLSVLLPDVTDLKWLRRQRPPAGAIVFDDPGKSFLDLGTSASVSDTGELSRNWKDGIFTVDTLATQAATGNIGGRVEKLAGIEIRAECDCTIVVQSLDSAPIASSDRILISRSGASAPAVEGHLPFNSAPLRGIVSIRAKPGLLLYVLVGDGVRRPAKVLYEHGAYLVTLPDSIDSPWLLLEMSRSGG